MFFLSINRPRNIFQFLYQYIVSYHLMILESIIFGPNVFFYFCYFNNKIIFLDFNVSYFYVTFCIKYKKMNEFRIFLIKFTSVKGLFYLCLNMLYIKLW